MCRAASCSYSGASGFVLMLAGECPLFSAWGRFEDGAPALHEHLRRGELATRPCREWKGLRQRRLCTHARGGVPPLQRPELNNPGASRTEPPLGMSTCTAVGCLLRGWGDHRGWSPRSA